MPRYRMIIEYDGRSFSGWQRQERVLSAQGAIEDAILKFSGETTRVFGGGRTDAGVHALGQVAHADIRKQFSSCIVRDAINSYLRPLPISILEVKKAGEEFHARFSAVERSYLYRIRNRRSPLTFERGLIWWVPSFLDVDAMGEAALALIGHHDFSTFRSSKCQAKTPKKTLNTLTVQARENGLIEVKLTAKSFLYRQVRNIVGTLRLVGQGKWSRLRLEKALAARDRKAGGPTAPPDGLYLTGIRYDKEFSS
ncbi:MAG: tRNA pseudouridine synthase A [Alphaproteobacteria bacterium MarineAlpha3_Bin5]|nr:tRNA pseudouridine(38-40) synthase TruA [Magnetovibrio sp.]PPR79604.1 MAG: tRNA pseudouridine synthase A [Alphaproteobacteria bacterium MarineAlpha3_Bin5]